MNRKAKARNGDTLECLEQRAREVESLLAKASARYRSEAQRLRSFQEDRDRLRSEWQNLETRMRTWHGQCNPAYQKKHYGQVRS